MNASKIIIFIVVLVVFLAIVLKTTQDKVSSLPTQKTSAPAATIPAQTKPTAVTQQKQNDYNPVNNTQPENIPNQPEVTYTSEYDGKSQTFLKLKEKIAAYALQEFMLDKGLKLKPLMKFYDYTLFEFDSKTVGFDIAPNEQQQELVITIRQSTDAKSLLTDLATARGISIDSAEPKPLDSSSNYYLANLDGTSVLYYLGRAKPGYSALIAWIQKAPHTSAQVDYFKNAISFQ